MPWSWAKVKATNDDGKETANAMVDGLRIVTNDGEQVLGETTVLYEIKKTLGDSFVSIGSTHDDMQTVDEIHEALKTPGRGHGSAPRG